MTQVEILKIKLEGEDVSDGHVEVLLDQAKMIILNRRFPFQDYPKDDNGDYILEPRYLDLQIRIALELFAKEGAEGELSHTENSVTRYYGSAGISGALLNEIVPKGRVI